MMISFSVLLFFVLFLVIGKPDCRSAPYYGKWKARDVRSRWTQNERNGHTNFAKVRRAGDSAEGDYRKFLKPKRGDKLRLLAGRANGVECALLRGKEKSLRTIFITLRRMSEKKLIVLCNCCNELLSWGSRARLCGGSPADVDKQIMKIDIYIPLSDSYAKWNPLS